VDWKRRGGVGHLTVIKARLTVLADFDGEFFLVLVTDEKIPHLGLID
jgi:hypothetical protein